MPKEEPEKLIARSKWLTYIGGGLVIAIVGGQISAHSKQPILGIIGAGMDIAGLIILIMGIYFGISNMLSKRKSLKK